jgi:ribose-phosphate pyrophosphokinase
MELIGDVKGQNVILVDDMVDTAGTLTKAADLMIKNGANSVRAYCTHGILSGDAYDRLNKSKIEELVITTTVPKTHKCKKVRVVSVAQFFAQTITSVVKNESISAKWKSNQ